MSPSIKVSYILNIDQSEGSSDYDCRNIDGCGRPEARLFSTGGSQPGAPYGPADLKVGSRMLLIVVHKFSFRHS